MTFPTFQQRLQTQQVLLHNLGHSFVQDTGFFKILSAPIVSYSMATLRSVLAWNTSKQTETNPKSSEEEKLFAKTEALKTTIREFGGATMAFGVMASFNAVMDAPTKWFFGVERTRTDVTGPLKFVSKSVQNWITNKDLNITKAPEALGSGVAIHIPLKPQAHWQYQAQNWLARHWVFDPATLLGQPLQGLSKAQLVESALKEATSRDTLVKQGFNNIRSIGVPVAGGVLACMTGGWLLERTALLRFDKVMDLAQRLLHDKAQEAATTTVPVPSSPSKVKDVTPVFQDESSTACIQPEKQTFKAMAPLPVTPLTTTGLWY